MAADDSTIQIRLSRLIRSDPASILRCIQAIGDFSKFMPNVRESRVIQKGLGWFKTQWAVEIDGIPIRWVEEETIDFFKPAVRFRALQGDIPKFDGEWTFKPVPGGTEVVIEARIGLNLPMMGEFIAPVLRDKITTNFALMLDGLNNRLVSLKYREHLRKKNLVNGFAIIGHPYNTNNLIEYLQVLEPQFKPPSHEFLNKLFEYVPAYVLHSIKEFTSASGATAHGLAIVSTFVPDMLNLDPQMVLRKVIEACHVAEEHRIGVVALGGFTSIVGERFSRQIQEHVAVTLTTGNTFTVSLALDQVRRACRLMETDLSKATVCVVGGTGDIGGACVRMLSSEVRRILITGRSHEKIGAAVIEHLTQGSRAEIQGVADNQEAVRRADVVIAAASGTSAFLDEEVFKPGAVVCDLAYPKNISCRASRREDILIFSGGIAEIPQEIHLGFEIGLPSPRTLYGCFSEAILLDLEKRYESFSIGRGNITREKVDEIRAIGEKHGFRPAPFYWGRRLLTDGDVEKIKKAARVST